MFGKTSVSGVYAAGDNTTQARSPLSVATADGTIARTFVNHELISERF